MVSLKVADTSNLIAAVPCLLGFHPEDSLVVLVVSQGQVTATLRLDLPAKRHRSQVADQIARCVRNQENPAGVILVVYGGGTVDAVDILPQAGLIDELDYSLTCVRVKVLEAVWLEASVSGATWHCYCGCGRTGALPELEETEVAAVTAARGLVTFATRAEVAAQVAPVAEDILERRSALLDEASSGPRPEGAAGWKLVRAAVAAMAERSESLSDDEVVQLALALSDLRVRDASLSLAVDATAAAAEQLLLELTRGCPVPERAEPATLLAFFAYLRGDGGLASEALTQAAAACPGHRLAGLMRHALDEGLSPARVRELAIDAAAEARSLCEDDAHAD
ncbi:hypothetical protein Lesp02_02930 [Lentzea sp. NBRC 105346]|uniref:DUF4192 domain-containing protein n=1 Tax=Lentzea sp. NBRC 105346 TaxID=3032205 RepID=UPI0024A3A4B0|nr:DUF4192 domain-containing protein [Lentzea sp. NBRC 105346]GLZ28103.1 hypothetical protein Lesp02_02930 [Lentzea sp. NBRC 105346]